MLMNRSVNLDEAVNMGESNNKHNLNSLYNDNKIPSHRGLVMVSLNINSLISHIDELRIYINNTKIDILCINETK